MKFMFAFAGTVLLLATIPARAAYVSYSDWTSWPEMDRAIYIAGAFDQLTTIVGPASGQSYADRYQTCLTRDRTTNVQLAQNVRMFASARADLQGVPVPVALMQYLAFTCGSP